MQSHVIKISKKSVVAFAAVLVVLAPISFAHAADLSDNSYSYSPDTSYSYSSDTSSASSYSYSPDTSSSYTYSPDTSYSYSADTSYSYSPDTSYSYSPDTSYSYSPDTSYSYSPDTSYSYSPDTSYSYSTYTYSTPSYYTPSYHGGGGGGGCYGNCNPSPKPAPTCTITATPSTVTPLPGNSVTISWTSTNATKGNITNLGTNLPASGSHVVYPTQTTTYTGTFTGYNGQTVTCSATVTVTPPQCPAGYTGSYPNCVPPPQYCPSGYTGVYPNCVPPPVYNAPSCTITTNNYYGSNNWYNGNGPVTISWTSNYASYGWINNGIGSVPLSGSRTVYPTQTTTYTGTFTGVSGQTVTCSATVYVNQYVPPVVPPIYPSTPYVTLTQVPYTGLDLGPVGTFLYWGFLVLWCLVAAYLIVVKRVQNKVAASLKTLLFGGPRVVAAAHGAHVQMHAVQPEHTHVAQIYAAPAAHEAGEDEFIVSQINRARN